MTVRRYWVHEDEPMEPEPIVPAPKEAEPLPATDPALSEAALFDQILTKLLNVTKAEPALYRAALHLLTRHGVPPPLAHRPGAPGDGSP